jgi:zeaxanthin glucosyltransferase
VTLLIISPDYASHALPMLTIGEAWRRRGERVVVATGPAMAPLVRRAGMEYTELIMSRGSNAGVLRTREALDTESRALEAFFAATRGGMAVALRFQAEQRAQDLLWRPGPVALRTARLIDLHQPDAVLVDHLAFGPTIGLRALGVPYGDVVVGHPTALPVGEELYGVPSSWPTVVNPNVVDLETVRDLARGVARAFTNVYNEALAALAPDVDPVDDAFTAHGDLVLYNYPVELHPEDRSAQLPRHVFLGSSVRTEVPDDEAATWLARPDPRPLVVVSFGTFLSARIDVLARIAAALRRVEARVAIAIGANTRSSLGPVPDDWLVRDRLPQVALLEHADLLISHAGNNSVTEAMTYGVPLLVMPFSTDQFDGAAAVERSLTGVALDPNRASRPLIAGTVRGLLRKPPSACAAIGARLRAAPGPEVAFEAMSEGLTLPLRVSSASIARLLAAVMW